MNRVFLSQMQEESTIHNPITFNEFVIQGDEVQNAEKVDIKALAALCEPKFAAAYKSAMGGKEIYTGAHRNPVFYAKVVVDAVKLAKDNKVLIPNGCCTMKDCPLHMYYATVMNELLSTHKE
jgi:hypothetical protein